MRLRPGSRLAPALLGLGLSLAAGPAPAGGLAPLPPQPAGVPWPTHAWPEGRPGAAGAGADADALAAALSGLFAAVGRSGLPDTRAALVVHRGRIVAERYASGFDAASRFHSWSMAKSVTQMAVGILVGKGELRLDAPAPVPAWRGDGDPRGAITLRHLLHMTSGLDNADDGDAPDSFVARLLFGDLAGDTAKHAAAVPLLHGPGDHWAYSTATTAILSGIVRRQVGGVGGGPEATLAFFRRELAEPLGLRSLVVEFDAAGTFLGGGFVWMSARDWARLGFLLLRDGIWEGRRVLPAGWVDFARTPAPAENNGTFGAHLWVNAEPAPGQFRAFAGEAPSAFQMNGAKGQIVALFPTKDLVVVRLGVMQASDWDTLLPGVAAVAAAFPRLPGTRAAGSAP